jgi:hypothetical protein
MGNYFSNGLKQFDHTSLGLKPADLPQSAGDQWAKQFLSGVIDPIGKTIQSGIQQTIGDSISAGFDAAFAKGANIGKVAGAFAGTALKTLGATFKSIGEQSLLGLQFMQAIQNAIASWNPVFGIAASIGLIALGSFLQSAGGRADGEPAVEVEEVAGRATPRTLDRGRSW